MMLASNQDKHYTRHTVHADDWQACLHFDPANIFGACDQETRDRYVLAVIAVATQLGQPPHLVVQSALDLATRADEGSVAHHVGYYLVDDGVAALGASLGAPQSTKSLAAIGRMRRLLGLNSMLALAISLPAIWCFGAFHLSSPVAILCVIAIFLVAYDYSTNLAHRVLGAKLPGRWLPTLDFVRSGLPDDCRTLIAVPCLLVSKQQIDAVLEAQMWNFRVANDENVKVALLSDFCDSSTGVDTACERALLDYALDRVCELNGAAAGRASPFLLLHRDRTLSHTQRMWIGRERKRGKIDALNRVVSGEASEFRVLCGDAAWLIGTRFIVCLDEDSRLSRDAVQLLAGALAHPLNAAVVNPEDHTIVRGHALLVPVLRTRSRSAAQWRLASIITGPQLDETRPVVAMRDFHYDFHGATHFPGKGMYEVAAYRRACEGRIPDERVLSHDTIEGAWLRPGFCGRAQVVEGFPSNQRQLHARQLRWVIGDWQNLFFLGAELARAGSKAVPALLRSIVLNQARISLTPVFLTALLVLAISPLAESPGRAVAAVVGVLLLPLYARAAQSMLMEPGTWFRATSGNLQALLLGHISTLYRVLRAPLDALITMTAVVLAAWRTMTGRKLLQWRAASLMEAHASSTSTIPAMSYVVSAIALVSLTLLALAASLSLPALLVVATWLILPAALAWTARKRAHHLATPTPVGSESDASTALPSE